MNKFEFFTEVSQFLDDVPMTEVLKSRGIEVIDAHTPNAKALCPFHADRTFGSFMVSNRKKIYKCFSCGAGGGSVHKLVYALNQGQRTFEESVMETALEFGIVTNEQYEWYFKRRHKSEAMQELKKFYCERMPESSITRANAQTLHKIYTIFREGWLLQEPTQTTSTLSPEHYQYLIESRQLTPQQIVEGEYFTMPNRYAFGRFVKRLMAVGLVPTHSNWKEADLSILQGVPGFYQWRDTGRWTFKTIKGVGIPLHNAEGLIVGIQVRKDEVKAGQNRYTWFTSSFADEFNEKFEGGCSPGAPIDVIYPPEIKSTALFITEGLFKSQMLSTQFQSIALSVQGVSTWRNIGQEIKGVLAKGHLISHLYIAFDADMAHNPEVFKQALRMTDSLALSFPTIQIVYVCWDEAMGKGVDDMILNGYKSRLAKMPKPQFDALYQQFKQTLEIQYQAKTVDDWRKIPLESMTDLFNQLVLSQFNGYS